MLLALSKRETIMIVIHLFTLFLVIPFLSTSPIIEQDPPAAVLEANSMLEKNIIDEEVLSMLRPDSVTELRPDPSGVCVFVQSTAGVYSYKSPGDTDAVCGLYVITSPDQFVEFEFERFDLSCNNGGLLSVIDGWELNGQFFPGTMDHQTPRKERYHEYCGLAKPWKRFKMSQNVGLIEFRIPTKGEGFSIKVSFSSNIKPCNVLLQDPQGVYTVRNYGRKINCTVSIMFPETFRILAMSVAAENRFTPISALSSIAVAGTTNSNLESASGVGGTVIAPSRSTYVETGIIRKCKKRGSNDYVEIKGGSGLDPDAMIVIEDVCGVDSIPSKRKLEVDCGSTAIRLVSSGKFDNSITIAFDLLEASNQQCHYPSSLTSD